MAKPLEKFNNISLQDIPKILPLLSLAEQEQLLHQLAHLERLKHREQAQNKFIEFVHEVWPTFIGGRHHKIMAEAFERVAKGELKRLIINMPPRHTKSEFASYLLPAWFLGKFPHKKVIQTSHTAELAVGFGRKVRNLVDSEVYKEIFPGLALSSDSKAAGRWNTNKGGDYFAIGVGGAVTGKGADCAYFSCKIRTKRGIVPISDVRVGDYVEGYNHATQRVEWTRVHAVSTQFKPELVNVNGIWVTPDHRVYTSAGYQPAGAARDVAVPDVWEGVSTETLRAPAEPPKASEGEGGLLFVQVLPYSEASAGLPVWEQEEPNRLRMQDLLFGANQGRGFLRTLWNAIQEVRVRVPEGGRAARGGLTALLYQRVLRQLEDAARRRTGAVHWALQRLWGFLARQAQEVLFSRVLQHTQWRLWGVRGGLELSEAAGAAARQPDMRVLWAGEAEGGGASYRPRCGQQRVGERDHTLRTVPQPLSSSRLGVSASDLRPLLQGEGYWVVDIQTGTSNFFSEGKLLHNCLIIDDPHSEQEATAAETSPEIYDKVYEWYTSGPRQRLQPGGAIVIVMCMTGDTPVLMADGVEKPLSQLRPGDRVSTFENGRLATSKVNNWRSSGVDTIYKIQTQSGKILRANERHPFLVLDNGALEWTRVNQLRVGDLLVSLKGAMTVTSQSDMANRHIYLNKLQRISDFTTDPIVAITPDGEEEVFDVEIDRTENFIANGVVSHNTRWSKRDLTAQVLKAAAQRGGDEWEVIEFPAIMPSGNPLWPEFWSAEELAALKEELPNAKWMAQYQQNPTSDVAAVIKRDQWNRWEKEDPPKCEFILQAWDTAFEANTRADFSACTTWGVFFNEEAEAYHVILLNGVKDRVEFPKLKQMVLAEYKEYEPDCLIVEKKASGAPLIYELRAMGVPVQEFTPVRGAANNPNNKVARLNSISDLFASGIVWAPNKSWAEQVIDEVASFPSGEHDDYVDTVIMALMRFRQGGFLRLPSDEKEVEKFFSRRKGGGYY